MLIVWRIFKVLCALVIAAALIGGGVLATYEAKWFRELPDYHELDSLTLGATTRVYARDLTPLGALVPKIGDERVSRTLVSLDDVSPYMVAALISSEDRHFFEHYGLDPNGLGRQFVRVYKNERVQGGSTLTNQLVANTLLKKYDKARTLERKSKEWMLSVQVERSFTKEEILQDYLNVIYWGDGGPVELYGLYSAAQAYFGVTPKQLTLAQAVYLTRLIPSPGRFYSNYKDVRPYMRALLSTMVEDGWITRAQADAAWKEKLTPRGWKVQYDAQGNLKNARLVDPKAKNLRAVSSARAPHFMQQVEQELVNRLGRERVYQVGGLNVYTTLDPQAQNAAEQASRSANIPPGTTLGAVLEDPFTGDVLAMIGQKLNGDQPPSEWNNAAQGSNQIGSTVKPLLYTTALSTGLDQLHKEDDKPISYPCKGCKGGVYSPQDFEGEMTNRSMTLREALDRSLNLPTVRLADRIGVPTLKGKLRELGLEPADAAGLAVALGAVETTPVKLAAAYAPFVNGGVYHAPRYVTRVTDASGQVLYDADRDTPPPHRVWTPQVAYLGLDMLQGVVNDLSRAQGGLAYRAKIDGWPVGGKTGTSNGPKDLWFVGVTPEYVGAVWVGKQDDKPMPTYYYSGEIPPPVWHSMMTGALVGKAPQQFAVPPGIGYKENPELRNVKVAVLDSGFQNAANTPTETQPTGPLYQEASAPSTDSDTMLVTLDRRTNRLATEFTPPEDVVQRRVNAEDLPAYAPDPTPQALTDDPPTPTRGTSGASTASGIPGAPANSN